MTTDSRLRSFLRSLRRHRLPPMPLAALDAAELDPGALALAARLDAIDAKLATLNKLIGGSLLAIVGEVLRQLVTQ